MVGRPTILSASPGNPYSISFQVRNFIRYRRRARPIRALATIAEKFLRAYNNEGVYDFQNDGELFLLETYRSWRIERASVVWDVGANAGQWAAMVKSILGDVQIHSFEVLPSIADAYHDFLAQEAWACLHRCGLSDFPGRVEVQWHRSSDQESAINMREVKDKSLPIETVTCEVATIDLKVAQGVATPHFLKIDTEGHEGAILRGGTGLLHGPDAPELIQLEYGTTWIPARETLERVHSFLEAAGYTVGRLYPRHVEFKAYEYADETFQMGNIIACRDPGLTRLLAG